MEQEAIQKAPQTMIQPPADDMMSAGLAQPQMLQQPVAQAVDADMMSASSNKNQSAFQGSMQNVSPQALFGSAPQQQAQPKIQINAKSNQA